MRVVKVCLAALVMVSLFGCANLRRWEMVEIGMTPEQVKAIMGTPQEMDAGDQGQGLEGAWMYTNIWGTSYYEIIFEKGKVAEKHARTIRSW